MAKKSDVNDLQQSIVVLRGEGEASLGTFQMPPWCAQVHECQVSQGEKLADILVLLIIGGNPNPTR